MDARRFGGGFGDTTRPEYGELTGVLSAMRVVVRYHGESSEVWREMFKHLIEASRGLPLADVTTDTSSRDMRRIRMASSRGSMDR
jgi:hypothetical protein